jgi:hypothetical protein
LAPVSDVSKCGGTFHLKEVGTLGAMTLGITGLRITKLCIMTLSIMALGITTFSETIRKFNTWHNGAGYLLSVCWVSHVVLLC